MDIKATLTRIEGSVKQTLGQLEFFNGIKSLFECKTLELPDKGNQARISRIPAGVYTCVLRHSPKYGWTFHVTDVEGRSFILIHWGNYYTNTKGCILVGNAFYDIDGDGQKDITSSKKTFKRMMKIIDTSFELTIVDL